MVTINEVQAIGRMNPTWGKNWNRAEATTWLFINLSSSEQELKPESWWLKVVSDAFNGVWGRLTEVKQFSRISDQLQRALPTLSAKMSAVGLSDDAKLPPKVWMRLMSEANLDPVGSAWEGVREWEARKRKSGKTVLYVYVDTATGKRKGPRRERAGLGRVRGYSPDELLSEKMKKPDHWPYCREWERVVDSPEKPAKETATGKQDRMPAKEASPVATVTSDDDAVAPKRKTRRRSPKKMVRACGARVINALEQSLAKEVSRKKSLLVAGGRNRRAYNCDQSLNELVAALKTKYAKRLNYADSTLKSAVSHFVSCPRGRPSERR